MRGIVAFFNDIETFADATPIAGRVGRPLTPLPERRLHGHRLQERRKPFLQRT